MNDSHTLGSSALYIELDCLLDTRLAVIDLIDPSLTKTIIKEGYFNRDCDVFNGINPLQFKEVYDSRDTRVLHNSIVSPMATVLNEFAVKTINLLSTSPYQDKPKIILNIYPYKLTDAEINTFMTITRFLTDGLSDVKIVDKKPELITPKYLKKGVTIAVMYDYPTWIEMHSANENFKKTTCPEVTLISPRIYFEKSDVTTSLDPFESMISLMGPLIGLDLQPISLFSANFPLGK